MDIMVRHVGATAVLTLRGELDNGSTYLLYEQAATLFGEAPSTTALLLDLTAVSFTDTIGLGMLIRIRELAERHHAGCELHGANPRLHRDGRDGA